LYDLDSRILAPLDGRNNGGSRRDDIVYQCYWLTRLRPTLDPPLSSVILLLLSHTEGVDVVLTGGRGMRDRTCDRISSSRQPANASHVIAQPSKENFPY
jgi:hypothetical protein